VILFALAYLGGVLTILSPCILPVLPFVFARADRPFVRSGLPMLVGMALTFALVATLAAVGGGWAVRANEYGRWIALVLLAVFALTLLFPWLSDRLTRPLVALGGRLTEATTAETSPWQSVALGVATGLLWAPCAGPILGLILTAAALQGASASSALLLLTYAAGAGTSLAVALLAGRKVFAALNRSQKAEEWIRRVLGAGVLAAVAAVAFGLDRGVLTRLSGPATSSIEQGLIASLDPSRAPRPTPAAVSEDDLPVFGPSPSIDGAVAWLNSPPLSVAGLKGKVVVIDFWTYSCINCLRSIPYVEAWAQRYAGQGLVVIGVHTPEFAFEREEANVRKAVKDLGVTYPVAIDSKWTIWNAFHNNYWPAHYFIDAEGRLRYEHFGEGAYDKSEEVIRRLLAERDGHAVAGALAQVRAGGVQEAPDFAAMASPETYLGYAKAQRFSSVTAMRKGRAAAYVAPADLKLNQWALSGRWKVSREFAASEAKGASIAFRFRARDLHMVLGPARQGEKVRFRVLIDGHAPGADHGLDVDANGDGAIGGQRLYQLLRQRDAKGDHQFEIEFLDPGAQAFTFTFG
jgi:cytochrome c biogenesis protein CcdA/thiol-disulfide isomerase/thioredoxin